MDRFTISLNEDLARQFDELIQKKGYQNRSEAVRDMLRNELESRVASVLADCSTPESIDFLTVSNSWSRKPSSVPRFSSAINDAYLKVHLSAAYQEANLTENESVHEASSDQLRAAWRWCGLCASLDVCSAAVKARFIASLETMPLPKSIASVRASRIPLP